MPEHESTDERLEDQTGGAESDPAMVALDQLTKSLLKIPKEELDRRVAEDLAANRGKRRPTV